MKKVFKWIAIVLLSPILLFLILAALLYVPPIQNWVAQKVVAWASEKTGMEISVEHVDIDFPLNLGIDGMRVIQGTDTIADIRRTVADVKLWPLLNGDIVVEGLELSDAKINTIDFIDDLRLQGTIGTLSLSLPDLDLGQMEVMLDYPRLEDANLTVYMSDTAAIDTSTTGWYIRFDRFDLERTRLQLVMDSAALFPDTATRISAVLGQARIADADLDLGLARFAFGRIDWQEGALSYNRQLALSHIDLHLDSLYAYGSDLRVGIGSGSLHEDSTGLELTRLQGQIALSGEQLHIDNFSASTPRSQLTAQAHVDLSSLDNPDRSDRLVSLELDASLDRSDLLRVMPELASLPDYPLSLHGHLNGSMKQLNVERLSIVVPTVLQAEASGRLGNLTDLDNLTAQLDLETNLYDVSSLSPFFSLPADYRLPKGLSLKGSIGSKQGQYTANLTASEGGGIARLKGYYHPKTESYEADIAVRNLQLRHFMPRDSLGLVTADVQLSGRGIDPMGSHSQLRADAQLHQLQYGSWQLDSINAAVTLSDGHALVKATSANALMGGDIDIDAQLGGSHVAATIEARLSHVDLFALGIASAPTVVGLNGSVQLDSDGKLTHNVSALLDDLYIRDSVATYHPEKLGLLLKTGQDTTKVRMQSGDLILKLDAPDNYQHLLAGFSMLADTLASQLKNRTIDQPQLKQLLPTASLYLTSRQNNPLANMLKSAMGITFKDLTANFTSSPTNGLNGDLVLLALDMAGTPLDTIRLSLVDKVTRQTFNGQVTNGRRNKMAVFNLLFDGQLHEHGARIGVRYYDEKNRESVRIGAQADMVSGGLNFRLMPSRPTLGGKEFALNDDNFLLLHDNLKLEANIDMQADDGTHISVYTENQDSTLLQDITISAHQLNLSELTSDVALLPNIAGMLEGDYHLMMDAGHKISIASDMHIDQLAYEGSHIGDLGSEFVYLLREDGTHVVDGTLSLADEPIGTLQGSYSSQKELDATLELTHMPLSIANGFMPDQLLGFEGYADGTLSMKGKMSKLMANGEVRLSDGALFSTPYGMRMLIGDMPLQIKESRLLFDRFTLYAQAAGDNRSQNSIGNPLYINGSANFLSDNSSQAIDLRISARDFLLVNAKQKKESVAYGRMFVNFFARLNGSLSQLNMRGRLDVLGTTDLNYILLDSPLSTDNQMDELVRFTDFSDTTQVTVERPESDVLNLDVSLNIDQGAHVRCALNAEQTNYVDLYGGGNLRMLIGSDGLNLTGRYTVESGTMKYSLPVIPLKTFNIEQGSYVEFTGEADNPTLSIKATERKRAAVTTEDAQTRSVNFDCGVVITRTLADMGLQFIISAPEDMQVQNELSSMSAEQRGKLAVTMLTTGMYLADGNTSSFSMNAALSSFLQSEINSITAGALKTVDLQVGLDNSTDASGQMHTDYSFRFAKRFWNNRLNVQIGGKVSTGSEVQGQNQSFFDNVTMEYRLSPTSNQYVKLFYNQNVYDWLDGYTSEYGCGFVWKRKLDRLIDIFKLTPSQPIPNQLNPNAPTPNPSLREGRWGLNTNVVVPQDSLRRNDSIQ